MNEMKRSVAQLVGLSSEVISVSFENYKFINVIVEVCRITVNVK